MRTGSEGGIDAAEATPMTVRIEDYSEDLDYDPAPPPAKDGALVYWMDPKPLSVGPAGISVAAGTAFALGAAAAVTALALLRWLSPKPFAIRRR